MQNRSALWIFTILLTLACFYQLSFSLFTGRFEDKAKENAAYQADSTIQANPAEQLDLDSLKLHFGNKYLRDNKEQKVYPLLGYSYNECKEKELNMGLDLKGGMSVTLEVSIPEMIVGLSDNSQNETFKTAISNAKLRQLNDDADYITMFAEEFQKADPNASLAAIFHARDMKDMFPRDATNEEIIGKLREEARSAVENTEKILRTRIDKFGVSQPSIQKQKVGGRILIELPGVKDKDRVRKVLQSTANLEFWETYDNSEIYPQLEQANNALAGNTVGEEFTRKLSSGVEIKGSAKGVESGLVQFMESNKPADKTTWFNFDRVTFRTGSADLDTDKSNEQLANIHEILKAYPELTLKIGGYTDSTGSAEINNKLSQDRADAVRSDLTARGVDGARLDAEGYGSQHPIATNETEAGRAQNRRMAVRVMTKGGETAANTTDPDTIEQATAAEDALLGDEQDELLGADDDTLSVENAEEERLKFQKENPLFAVLTPAVSRGANDQFQLSRGSVIGYANISDTAKVNQLFQKEAVRKALPKDARLIWGAKPFGSALPLYAIKVPRGGDPKLDGSVITDASQDFDLQGDVEVAMQMNAEGAQTWKVMTGDNVGKVVAIVLDGLVYSAPTVISEISGGRSSISMGAGDVNEQIQNADDLANILKAGALPAPARIIDETIVGPSLGAENVRTGLLSFLAALALVLIYMILYYARAGIIADIALVLNLLFLIGSLASLQAALTLPGIAGIVLTIGMAVDANVLIFERIREELRAGKMAKSAVDFGYSIRGAMSAILDANVTTLVTAIILFFFGSGPIKGFATTLIIGIFTSLFSAIFITRLLIYRRLDKKKDLSFWSNATKNILVNANFNFVGKRRIFYIVSLSLIGVGVFSMFSRGFNLGVDFSGGRSYVVRFDEEVNVGDVRNALSDKFVSEERRYTTNVKTYGISRQMKVTTNYLIDDLGSDIDEQVEARLSDGLAEVNTNYSIVESRKVDATISDDIKKNSLIAITLALIFIFFYIAVRFNKWQFGAGALIALVHDVLIVLGIYSLLHGILPFSLEIDEAFIAAILTVVGYSINDTVVVFDRIREYLREHKRESQASVVNKAMNATLSRTLNTSFTTFLVLLIIFLFGGVSIQGFVFALMIGVVVGTYSSLFVASNAVVDLTKDIEGSKYLHEG